jgi:hypothetical protein
MMRYLIRDSPDQTDLPGGSPIWGRATIIENKPVMFDDTVNFLAYQDYKRAKTDIEKLNSKPTQNLTKSLAFWDAKRPITTSLLNFLVQRRKAYT